MGAAGYGADILIFAPPIDERVEVESRVRVEAEFSGSEVLLGDLAIPAEFVIQGFDEALLSGELVLAVRLDVVRESSEHRVSRLVGAERSGKELDEVAGLAPGQGVRYRLQNDLWRGRAIDEDNELLEDGPLDALSPNACFEVLLGDGSADVGDSWNIAVDASEALGLAFPGLGTGALAELLPAGQVSEDGGGLREGLREFAPEVLGDLGEELVLGCRYVSREGDLATLEIEGDWRIELNLDDPMRRVVRVDEEAENPREMRTRAVLALEPEATLVWDLRRCLPVEFEFESDWTLGLAFGATVDFESPDVPFSAEVEWQGWIGSSTTVE